MLFYNSRDQKFQSGLKEWKQCTVSTSRMIYLLTFPSPGLTHTPGHLVSVFLFQCQEHHTKSSESALSVSPSGAPICFSWSMWFYWVHLDNAVETLSKHVNYVPRMLIPFAQQFQVTMSSSQRDWRVQEPIVEKIILFLVEMAPAFNKRSWLCVHGPSVVWIKYFPGIR